jgi:hypothetical protein
MAQNGPVSRGAYQQLIFADFASEFNHHVHHMNFFVDL